MATFGLVHGGGFGAWCWDLVLPELEERGHRGATIDLLPEHLAAGAAHCADRIHQAFSGCSDLVLVGHSLAGLLIPLVATRRPVQRLIFLHALLPRPGQSILDQVKAEPDMFNPEMFAAPAPFWEDEAVAIRFLLHDCPPEVVDRAFSQLRPKPGVLGRGGFPFEGLPGVPRT